MSLLCFACIGLAATSASSHENTAHQERNPLMDTKSIFKKVILPSSELYSVDLVTRDITGQPTPVFLAIKYIDSWQWVMLEQPFLSNPRSTGQRSYRPQWKTKFPIHSTGRVRVSLPKGRYLLYVGKGLEYAPIKHPFEVSDHSVPVVDITIERFIDMPAKGWWSGDTHVHAARAGSKDDRELLWASQAEDIHISSILTMGDQDFLHFPQYAYGNVGTANDGDFWLVPGQEEPRTSELGHTIILNTHRLYRDADNYYRYDTLFRQARIDGALTGVAHYFYDKFLSRNAGALLLAEDLVDFVEILDDTGMFKPEQYYEALNMGAHLSLSAGSDFPWGGHIGDNRTYALLAKGEALTPEKWYSALKAGRTFVTQGPMLDFKIDGRPVGSDIFVKKGAQLEISVRAEGHPEIASPKRVWLVSMGDILHEIETEKRDAGVLEFSLTLRARMSQWYAVAVEAHNGAVAHSSPIYVWVDGAAPRVEYDRLLALYEKNLTRIDNLSSQDFVPVKQREKFQSWLSRIRSVYTGKIAELKNEKGITVKDKDDR